ncbi:MAG TPA: hypothetical protein VE869_01935 [Gemmatimonas sp.]|nr:hypothetical protein [Gemmatimonas sp.]
MTLVPSIRSESTDTLVASITVGGMVTSAGVGTAVITATAENTFGRADIIVRPGSVSIVGGAAATRHK